MVKRTWDKPDRQKEGALPGITDGGDPQVKDTVSSGIPDIYADVGVKVPHGKKLRRGEQLRENTKRESEGKRSCPWCWKLLAQMLIRSVSSAAESYMNPAASNLHLSSEVTGVLSYCMRQPFPI